ncbi:methyltransferase domain-containing protein [Halorubrum sp. LN27]|uniref:class I SAM-dependent methyltransferase n=1 Tax=Halorubrum sp. LN27 TaxID=2801032 RepID=UPI00190931AA|nr:methyltransferase domain-containing protein [Halorubrum sp. LN27]
MPDRVSAICDAVEGPTVLDLGAVQHEAAAAADDDWLHGRLCDRYESVIGIDTEADAVDELRDRGYDIRVGDATDLSVDVTADTVVAGELIEHVSDPGGLIESARRHLRPGGQVVLSTPNPWLLAHVRRVLGGREQVNEAHVAWYGPTVLQQLLDRHGFSEISCFGVGPSHSGATGLAQRLGCERLGETTWLCLARRGQ